MSYSQKMSSLYLNQTFFHWNISLIKTVRFSWNFTSKNCNLLTETSKRWSSNGRSYVHGVSSIPLLGISLSKLVDEAADRYGTQREAIVDRRQNIRKDFVQLRQDIDKLATGLLSLGLQKRDRIGIWTPNCYEWVLVQFAAARAGLILVCLNPAYQASELEYCLQKVTLSAIVSARTFKTQDYYKILSSVVPEIENSSSGIINSKKHPYFKYVIMLSSFSNTTAPGTLKFEDVLEAGGSEDRNRLSQLIDDIQPDDPVNIQFTSGTTGRSKGATLSHHNIANNAYFVGNRLKYNTEPHRVCVGVPLFHCFGNVLGSTCIFTNGVCCVLASPSFDPEANLKAIHHEKCTSIYGTPTMFVDMLNHPRLADYNYSSLKIGLMAGAPCPLELKVQVARKMNLKGLVGAYGTTETSPSILTCKIEGSNVMRSETDGYPTDHVEVKIVDENHRIVPCGTAGELWTRGFLTMLGYWDDEEKTKEVLTDSGWYRTGDLATLDENGYGKIVGRIKDMIISGGENIYPRELEDFFYTNPDVVEAHVIGMPDERLGEVVCIWIKLKEGKSMTEDAIQTFCKGKIAHFKIPRHIRFVDTFPKTGSGKIQKFVMREEMTKYLATIVSKKETTAI